MTLDKPTPVSEIRNIEHHNEGYLKILMHATNSGGDIIPIILTDEGKLG